MSGAKVRVLIAEDHQTVREGMRLLVAREPDMEVVGETADGREALRLIALGYSNKEIAAHLDVSVKTVEAHKANAMRKLGLGGRSDIVSYAIFRGWMNNT